MEIKNKEKELSTRDKILIESMKLFSVSGYDAVSVRKIAAAVGVRDSALYKHFSSKQAIFDAIVEQSKQRFLSKYGEVELTSDSIQEKDFEDMCLSMFRFQTKDDWVVMFRQMLLLEHYKNPKMAQTYIDLFVDMPVGYQEKIFTELIQQGIMRDRNARVMAIELYAPFFLYHTIQTNLDELEVMFRQHVKNFIEAYFIF